jgi:hypothetical protein
VRRADCLLGGLLLATSPRVDWATLLRRTFDVDVLACTRCHGRLRLLSVITEPATLRRILEHLGIPATAPPIYYLEPATRRRASPPGRRARSRASSDAAAHRVLRVKRRPRPRSTDRAAPTTGAGRTVVVV